MIQVQLMREPLHFSRKMDGPGGKLRQLLLVPQGHT